MADVQRYRDRLLIEIIAEKLGFGRLSDALTGGDVYPPYLLVAVGLFVEYGLFDVYNFLVSGKSSFFVQPNSLAIPAMTVLGVFGLRYIHESYADAMIALGIDDEHVDIDASIRRQFEGLVSLRTRTAAYVVALVAFYAFGAFVLGFPRLIETDGIGLVLYAQAVSFPLITIPILVELGVSYVAVHLAVPRRLAKADFGLFYYDPRNLGGFEPVGELLKRSYYIYTGVLLLWFLQTHIPVILSQYLSSPYPAPGPGFQAVLSAVWFVGVLTIGYSMYRVHAIMKSKKRAKIRSLERELKRSVSDPFDATLTDIENREQYENAQETLTHVESTGTYPTTFAMWSQIFVSVLLPQALNLVVQLPG